MEKYKIDIANEFSPVIGGRYIRLGAFSGELFYNEFLKPRYNEAKNNSEKLHVFLDGTKGYGSSFLDESFGKLFRENGVEVQENIVFHTDFFKWIVSYIQEIIWIKK